MNAKADPQRMIATVVRVPASQLDRWKDARAESYAQHRLSFNQWLIAAIERGLTQ